MEKQRSDSKTVSWVRGKWIGNGCFGSVSIGANKSDGRVFAVKSVDLDTCLPGRIESLENEIRILRSISSSPHIVGFLGDDVSHEPPATTSYRNLHLEYFPRGTVADLASRQGSELDEKVLRRYTWCVVSALRHVHSQGIVHCDVKGKNILVGPNLSSVKLADFGSAMEVSGERSTAMILPRGSPLWMAPEVIRREYQGPESDVWSLGCTIIEMVTGKPAWEDHGIDTLSRIGFSDELPLLPTRLSELGRDFLEQCLRREPNQRWSCDQLLQHPFLSPNNTVPIELSPRCVLDWVNSDFEEEECEIGTGSISDFEFIGEVSAKDAIGKLAASTGANWESDGWVAVRGCSHEEASEKYGGDDEAEGTSTEHPDSTRAEWEREGTSSVYSDSSLWITEGSEVERTKWEFFNSNSSNSDFLEWQYCNIYELLALTVVSTSGLRCGGGSSCPYGSQNVGFAVERQWIGCYYISCNLLRIFKYILPSLLFIIYIFPVLFSDLNLCM